MSPPASLSFQGQATKQATVKWCIDKIIVDFSLKAFKCNCEVHIEWKKPDFHIFFSVQVMCLQISQIHVGARWTLLSEFSLTFR